MAELIKSVLPSNVERVIQPLLNAGWSVSQMCAATVNFGAYTYIGDNFEGRIVFILEKFDSDEIVYQK